MKHLSLRQDEVAELFATHHHYPPPHIITTHHLSASAVQYSYTNYYTTDYVTSILHTRVTRTTTLHPTSNTFVKVSLREGHFLRQLIILR